MLVFFVLMAVTHDRMPLTGCSAMTLLRQMSPPPHP